MNSTIAVWFPSYTLCLHRQHTFGKLGCHNWHVPRHLCSVFKKLCSQSTTALAASGVLHLLGRLLSTVSS